MNQNATSASVNWVGPEIRPPGRSVVGSYGQRATASPGPVSMQRYPPADADANSRAKNSLIASGLGMSIATRRRYRERRCAGGGRLCQSLADRGGELVPDADPVGRVGDRVAGDDAARPGADQL